MSACAGLIELEVPARSEFLRVVRLVVAGLGSAAHFNLEEIEDLKIAASEACYASFEGTEAPSARVQVSARLLEDGVEIRVGRDGSPSEGGAGFRCPDQGSVALSLLEQVVDEVSCLRDGGGERICLVKRRSHAQLAARQVP